jgi:N-acylneuraminate cytidylyltransferase
MHTDARRHTDADNAVVAYIPARGGSKRFKHKNLADFCGRPLLYHSIAFAQWCGLGDSIYVSTESPAIADVALQYGARVMKCPEHLCRDHSTQSEGQRHFMHTLEGQGIYPEYILHLQPTNPLRERHYYEQALKLMNEDDWDCVVAVHRSREKRGKIEKGEFIPTEYYFGQCTQELKPRYVENGMLYLTRVSALKRTGSLFGKKAAALEVEDMYAMVDVDKPLDLEWAAYICCSHADRFPWMEARIENTDLKKKRNYEKTL